MASFAARFATATHQAEREDQARRKQVVESVIEQLDVQCADGARGEIMAVVPDVHTSDKALFASWEWWYKRLGFEMIKTGANEQSYDPQYDVKAKVDMHRNLRVSVSRKPMNLPV